MAERLMFTLEGDIHLTFGLEGESPLAFGVETPHVIDAEIYAGDYEVTPMTHTQILYTNDKLMTDDVTVKEIPYFETSNENGTTVYIARTV